MKYMVIHERLKNGNWRTFVPDVPGCKASGVKPETRMRTVTKDVLKHLNRLVARGEPLPKSVTTVLHMKRTVSRCYVHFIDADHITSGSN